MGELNISSDVIDLCLNHKKAKKTTRTYQRQTMLPQRAEAFGALGAHLTEVLGDPNGWLPAICDVGGILQGKRKGSANSPLLPHTVSLAAFSVCSDCAIKGVRRAT